MSSANSKCCLKLGHKQPSQKSEMEVVVASAGARICIQSKLDFLEVEMNVHLKTIH